MSFGKVRSFVYFLPAQFRIGMPDKLKYFFLILFIVFSEVNGGTLTFPLLQSKPGKADTTKKKLFLQPVDTVKAIADTLLSDSLKRPVVKDTLRPIEYKGVQLNKNFKYEYSNSEIYKQNYRFIGDIFQYIPFGFMEDFGGYGQPNEIQLYGLGFGNIGYLVDGINVTDRLTNALDLHAIQSENISSIEILPLPRGFLYNPTSLPVSVNFNYRDEIRPIPLSRIRYVQGINDELFFDAIFSAYLMPRFNLTFDITSSKYGPRYTNSEYSTWKFSTKSRYLLSNRVNILGSYIFSRSETRLNGGVNVDFIREVVTEDQVESILYSPFEAPVYYTTRYEKSKKHQFKGTLLGNFLKDAPTILDAYYQFNLTEFRQNEKYNENTVPRIFNDNKYKVYGLNLRQSIKSGFYLIDLTGNYENTDYKADLLKDSKSVTSYFIGGEAQIFLLDGVITPSIFGKHLVYSGNGYSGLGGDLKFKVVEDIGLYAGYSTYERPLSLLEEQYLYNPALSSTSQNIKTFEIGAEFNSEIFSGTLKFFNFENDNELVPVIDVYSDSLIINETGFFNLQELTKSGVNLNFNFRFWKLLLTSNNSYYFNEKDNDNSGTPEISSWGGLYYVDRLFNNNLNLKTGLNFKYSSGQYFRIYDFEKRTSARFKRADGASDVELISGTKTNPPFQLDFFLAGTIQDLAIIYMVVENLLGKEYYVIPYYPKQSTNFRFGVSWELFN